MARRGAFCFPLETAGADPDTEAVLKGYLIGLLSATLAVFLVAVIWFGRQPPQEEGLLWGGKVYTSRQEFNGYLKSKGLSYETFVARNPGASPWEPDEFTIGPITVRASTKTREDWVVRLPLAAIGLMLAIGCALLLWLRLRTVTRTVTPGLARRSVAFLGPVSTVVLVAVIYGLLLAAIGLILATDYALLLLQRVRTVMARFARRSLVFFSQRNPRIGPSSAGRPTSSAFAQRLGVVTSGATRRLRASVPLYGERLVSAARPDARLLPRLRRERDISVAYVAFGLRRGPDRRGAGAVRRLILVPIARPRTPSSFGFPGGLLASPAPAGRGRGT